MRLNFIFFGLFLIVSFNVKSQTFDKTKSYLVTAVGFWNVENLYDTLNDPEKQDEEFLPDGVNGWTGPRYKTKIEHLALVISEMAVDATPDGLAILGLCEIENKNVLIDLVNSPKLKPRNYQIVHFEGPDARGVDPALLYNPKYFKVTKSLAYKLLLHTDTAHKTRDHPFRHFLSHEEGAAGVDVEHEVEVVGAHVDELLRRGHAGVVDQDVDAAHLGFGMGHRSLDAGMVGHVQRDHVGHAA